MSFSQAVRPLVPKSFLKNKELRRMTVDKAQAVTTADRATIVLVCVDEYTMTEAMTAGPDTKGIAKGTIKGSSVFFLRVFNCTFCRGKDHTHGNDEKDDTTRYRDGVTINFQKFKYIVTGKKEEEHNPKGNKHFS